MYICEYNHKEKLTNTLEYQRIVNHFRWSCYSLLKVVLLFQDRSSRSFTLQLISTTNLILPAILLH